MRWDRASYGVGFFPFSVYFPRQMGGVFIWGKGVLGTSYFSLLQRGFFLGDMGERGDSVVFKGERGIGQDLLKYAKLFF